VAIRCSCDPSTGTHSQFGSRDGSVGIASRLQAARLPAGATDSSIFLQTGSEAHPASYPVGTMGCILGVKRQGREADQSHSI
jgi:hypothetical protein